MAGSTNILQFNPDGNNQLNDASYSSASQRSEGITSSSIALSNVHNKLFYQLSGICASLSQAMANQGYTMADSDYDTLITNFETLVNTAGSKMTGQLQFAGPKTLTSSSGVLTLDGTSNTYYVQGTEAITSITSTVVTQGFFIIKWLSARTLTYGTNLQLLGSINRTTVYGDTGIYQRVGSVVTELFYMPLSGNSVPAGAMLQTFTSAAPAGYLLCDGSAISRTTYANLFAAIGVTYGSGDSITTFNLPDCRDKFILTKGTSYATLGATGGEANHTLTTSELPSHNHYNGVANDLVKPFVYGATTTDMPGSATSSMQEETTSRVYQGLTSSTGSGGSHNNMPPYIAINTCIKY